MSCCCVFIVVVVVVFSPIVMVLNCMPKKNEAFKAMKVFC